MRVLGVDNVFVPVGDLEAAVHFYGSVIGLPVTKRFDEMGTVLFQIGDETPGLGVWATDQPPAAGHKLWLEVADARSAADEMAAAGVAALAPPFLIPTGWAFEVEDPWGNVIGFTDYLQQPELGRDVAVPSEIGAPDRLESIDREECLALLAGERLGRFGFVVDGQPRITPVNYRLVGGEVVFGSRPGAKLDAVVRGQRVAFEVDSVEEWARAGWSVQVLGVALVVDDPAEVGRLSAGGPQPWAPGSEHSLIRVVAHEVSGRRVRVDPGGVSVLYQEADTEPSGP